VITAAALLTLSCSGNYDGLDVRKVLFWLHLSAGLTAGIVILVMCVTGVLLTYEQQIIRWAERGYRSTSPAAERLPIETLVTNATRALGAPPVTLTVRADREAPIEMVAGTRMLFLDAYTGEVRGEGAKGLRAFFRSVTDWHRRLAATGEYRDTGRAITGAANLLFLVLVLSGMVIWMPRKWSWRHVRPIAWFRGGLMGKARDFNWHNAIGIWCAVPLALVVLGALVISYPWATNLVYTLTGTEAPKAPAGPPRGGGSGGGTPQLAGVEDALRVAQARLPEWKAIVLRVPTRAAEPFALTVDLVDRRGRPDLRHALTVKGGEVVKAESFGEYNAGRKARTWLRWIHTGEAGGLAGQTVAGVASLGGAVLVWTGVALALRRFKAWRGRKASKNGGSLVNSDLRDVSQPTLQ
jgi:uncharacterized iron-regulated membrane protein